jgi:hypothetical protein
MASIGHKVKSKITIPRPSQPQQHQTKQHAHQQNHLEKNTIHNEHEHEHENESGAVIKAWGQQCSPNCGCTIRFEATLDPHNNHQIVSASYDAKTIVTQVQKVPLQNGQVSTFLAPVRTMSREHERRSTNNSSINGNGTTTSSRPMTKQCTCKTLHGLARTITQVLPNYSLSQAQNQLEYVGTRSSAAFRYSALKNLNLIQVQASNSNTNTAFGRKHPGETKKQEEEVQASASVVTVNIHHIPEGHCYDLVEEALMACIQGYIPKPRPAIQYQQQYQTTNYIANQVHQNESAAAVQRIDHYHGDTTRSTNENDNDEDGYLDPLRFVTAAKRRAKEGFFQSFRRPSSSSMNNNDTNTPSSSISTSSTTSSTGVSASSMPPFHLMADASHAHAHAANGGHDGHMHMMDTLTQIKMEIKSMNEQDDERNQRDEYVAWNDWVAYVDDKQNASQE